MPFLCSIERQVLKRRRKILHHTQGESDKRHITTALNAVERVLTIINESIREQESRERLAQVSRNLYVGQG